MARSDIDMLAIERINLEVNLPLREAIAHVEMLSNVRHISIECDLTDEANVLGDIHIHRLRQLFALLLDNAVSYSCENQTVSVTTDIVHNSAKSSLLWRLSIADQGIGISDEDMPHIFERSYRSARAKQLRPDGSGLGLPIAEALARAHGGHIEIESVPNHGTTVFLWLPITWETQLID